MRKAGTRVAVGLFWSLLLAGSVYYSLTRTYQLRPERRIMWAHAVEWWQGMSGHLLAQHREGLQVAELDPDTGRLLAVRDVGVDAAPVGQMLQALPHGHWLIITALELGSPDTTAALRKVLESSGWTGDLAPINAGGGIVVLGRSRESSTLFVVASQVAEQGPVAVELPAGTRGADGSTLARSLSILVKPYD